MASDWFAEALAELRNRPVTSEADVSAVLVRPVLKDVLGFTDAEIREQESGTGRRGSRLRPDFTCQRQGSAGVDVIVEVKTLGTDLMKRTGQAWDTAPVGQLQKYLQRFPQSGHGTWGIVTNGAMWVVAQRKGETVPFDAFRDTTVCGLSDVESALQHVAREPQDRGAPGVAPWLDWIVEAESPRDFVEKSGGRVKGIGDAAWTYLVEGVPAHSGTLFDLPRSASTPVFLACLRLDFPDGLLSTHDIADRVLELQEQEGLAGSILGMAFSDTGRDERRLCRGFVWMEGSLAATALLDPALPGSRAQHQFTELARHAAEGAAAQAFDTLSGRPLHQQFHEEIGTWFGSRPDPGNNDLRHLICVMFACLLQKRHILPGDALWNLSRPTREYDVHRHILWLFEEVLAKPVADRAAGDNEWRQALVKDVPFLNGSLFTRLAPEERPSEVQNRHYLGEDGLLSVLDRYDWTLSDRTSRVTESAIDPSMLGEMFERLILTTEGARQDERGGERMPHGTYYTPQDIAEEMSADAVAGWLAPKVHEVPWQDLRALVHPSPEGEEWKDWATPVQDRVLQLLHDATVLDPCCGSGVFTMAMLFGLARARQRLKAPSSLEQTIERQLHAVDLHPIAVLITRLRLFIALIDKRSPAREDIQPLPNLETRCIAANTLCVNLSRVRRLDDATWAEAIADLRAARELWTSAHDPAGKRYARTQEEKAREELRELGRTGMQSRDLEWLNWDFLSTSGTAAQHDIRDLFPAPAGGWDIVIGNPPYQRPAQENREQGIRRGYRGHSANLYLMFIEAAIVLAKAEGCITLIVPHSIVFRRHMAYHKVRGMVEQEALHIGLRTYDNRPQPIFSRLPWLTSGENRQRVTVMVVRKRAKAGRNRQIADTFSQGLIRLNASNRDNAIRNVREGQRQPRDVQIGLKQWTQAPTPELAELLCLMWNAGTTGGMYHRPSGPCRSECRKVRFPKSAYHFVTCIPDKDDAGNGIDSDLGKALCVKNDQFFWPWIGLYNSHLFLAWWLMVGDAFDVLPWQYMRVRMPQGWIDNASLRHQTAELARGLVKDDVLRASRSTNNMRVNYNFHKRGAPGAAIIAKLDRLLLEAYRLPCDSLLQQMYVIRDGSAHELIRGP